MPQPRILITGSAGTIGSVITRALSQRYDIFGFDQRASDGPHIRNVDIANYDELDRALTEVAPIDCIVHLAVAGKASNTAPEWESILRNNIIGTRNMYEAARHHSIPRVIFASSNHVTGGYEGLPHKVHKNIEVESISAQSAIRPDGDYATSKVFGESIARQYYETHGIESICLRIGTVLTDDDSPNRLRHRRTWLSHGDLVQLIEKSILADVKFGVYYGVSNNAERIWSIQDARKELGYRPQDDATLFSQRLPGFSAPRRVSAPRSPRKHLLHAIRPIHRRFSAWCPSLASRLRVWLSPPKHRSLISGNLSAVVTVPIQPAVFLEVYWVGMSFGWGPGASLTIHDQEILRFDCFGGNQGHLHARSRGGIGGRLYFEEGTVESHIERAIFELKRNLNWYLAFSENPKITNIKIDPVRLCEATDQMRTYMLDLAAENGTRGKQAPDAPLLNPLLVE